MQSPVEVAGLGNSGLRILHGARQAFRPGGALLALNSRHIAFRAWHVSGNGGGMFW